MSSFDFDLFTIGAGSGGVRASRMAAQFGAKVAIAEEYRVGGTCVIRGCVPKKLFVYASHFAEDFEDARGFGWQAEHPEFSWSKLIENKDREIDRLNRIYTDNLTKAGVKIFLSRAVVKDPHTIEILDENRTVTAKHILIATGAKPNVHDGLPGLEHTITSNEAFHLERLPRRIIVAGGGYVAVEFAGIFAGLGVETTLLYRGEEILRGFDDDLRTTLHGEMEKKGIRILTGRIFSRIDRTDQGYRATLSDDSVVDTDLVMFAIGRDPNTGGLGLDSAGVELGARGAVIVDSFSRSTVDSISAVGDVTDRVALTPVAIQEGAAFAETVFNGNPTPVDHRLIPSAVFSQPEIGTVGLTEKQALERYEKIRIGRTTFRALKNTLSGRDETTLMKFVIEADTDRILGIHLLGPGSAEMIQLAAIPLRMGARKADFDATMAVHPTAAEELVTMRETRIVTR